jgi:hypothetical protein
MKKQAHSNVEWTCLLYPMLDSWSAKSAPPSVSGRYLQEANFFV